MERDRRPGVALARRTSAVARARRPVHPVLALQRSAGNRAVARAVQVDAAQVHAVQAGTGPTSAAPLVVQRRAPDPAVVGGIVGAGPAAVRAERKLKRVLEREVDRMEERVAGSRLLVANQLAAAVPGAVLATVLDPAVPLVNRADLAAVIAAISTVQTNAGGNLTQVLYPRPAVANGPPNAAEEDVLAKNVAVAIKLMLTLAAGGHAAVVTGVFGGQAAAARAMYQDAAVALARLHGTAGRISIDRRGDQAAVSAGALTGPEHMVLPPRVVAAIDDQNTITLVHESTHATPNRTSDDCYVDRVPGSPFLTATEVQKVRLAAHYEEAARVALGAGAMPVFNPGGGAPPPVAGALAPSVDLVRAWAAAERIVIRSWTVAINSHDALRGWANQQAAGSWNALSPADRAARDQQLRTASRNLGLLMHHQPVVPGAIVTITDLDLAVAQDRAAQLSKMIHKASGITAADDRTGPLSWIGSVERITGHVLRLLVGTYGPVRQDDARSVAMMRGLAATYDNQRFLDVCARVFV